MNLVTLDFETYWSDTHTLRKMSNIEYVMHPDTEIISCSIKVNGGWTEVWFGENQIRPAFADIDWDDTMVIGHNMSEFDALVLAWRFGIRPKMWGCTMAMARPIHAKTTGLSLGALVQHYGIGVKDNTALVQTKGKRLKEFDPFELEAMRRYNKDDTEQCYALFHELRKHYTAKELVLIDMTIRAMVEPKFLVDHTLLEQVLDKVRANKKKQLVALAHMIGAMRGKEFDLIAETLDWYNTDDIAEYVRAELASAPKFSAMLEKLGVEVPTKPSPTNPEKMIPALSKTDEGFIELQSHPDPLVSMAAGARLGVKSVQLETRIETFLKVCDATEGYLPVPLKYCGADTTGRWSGYQYNPQNLPRINPNKRQLSDALRLCMQAPAGHTIIVADQSGIELRVNHFLWKVESSMALYRKDPQADLYRAFAAARYGISPEEVDKSQRQLAKVAQLGLGFGAAWRTFQQVAKIMGGLDLTDEQAQEIVLDWRREYADIVNGWRTCHDSLPHIEAGREREIDPWGLCHTSKHGIHLPSGRIIRYPELRYEEDEGSGKREWWYGHGRHKARIYAGKITENCLAAGTLVLTSDGWVPIEDVRPDQLVHDGVEFVSHAGTVYKSVQPCVSVDGVYMTPDHEVLTGDGWQEASQLPRPYRPDLRHADGAQPGAVGRREVEVALPLPVRAADGEAGAGCNEGGQARGYAQLWMRHEVADQPRQHDAWNVEAPGVRRVAFDGGSLLPAVASGMGQLRRAWDHGVRTLARVLRELLGGHGADVLARVGLGPSRQQRTVLAGELPVGVPPGQHHEQAIVSSRGGRTGAGATNRDQPVDAVLQGAAGSTARPVYDILNCGPRHRFVVLGAGGPFIVHNCVQALARDTVADNAVEFRQLTGLSFSLMVHDELAYVVPKEEAVDKLHTLQTIMRRPPKWWPELITWSEGDSATRYGLAK